MPADATKLYVKHTKPVGQHKTFNENVMVMLGTNIIIKCKNGDVKQVSKTHKTNYPILF